MPKEVIKVSNLTKYYHINQKGLKKGKKKYLHAVNDVSFSINEGEIFGIVGESGCGKSTLARSILRLIEPTSGEVFLDGENVLKYSRKELKESREKMQIVFQNPFSSFNPQITLGKALYEVGKVYGLSKAEAKKKIDELLQYIGLNESVLERYPNQLSGGQLQRLAIGRVLIVNPKFIIADEAVSALDISVQAHILNLILYLRDKLNLTIMFISHDLTVVEHTCDHVAVMYLGSIVERAETIELFGNTKHPYTKALISSRPKENPDEEKEKIILEGDLPNPMEIFNGCSFFSRCPNCKKGKCDVEVPKLREISNNHFVACHFIEKDGEFLNLRFNI